MTRLLTFIMYSLGNVNNGIYKRNIQEMPFNLCILLIIYSKVPAFLHVTDIAGLVQGAHEGQVISQD